MPLRLHIDKVNSHDDKPIHARALARQGQNIKYVHALADIGSLPALYLSTSSRMEPEKLTFGPKSCSKAVNDKKHDLGDIQVQGRRETLQIELRSVFIYT